MRWKPHCKIALSVQGVLFACPIMCSSFVSGDSYRSEATLAVGAAHRHSTELQKAGVEREEAINTAFEEKVPRCTMKTLLDKTANWKSEVISPSKTAPLEVREGGNGEWGIVGYPSWGSRSIKMKFQSPSC